MQLKAENAALRERLASFEASAPAFVQTAEWLRTELPKLLEADYWQPTQVEIPILALRFTHNNVNASLAFGDSHENNQENILKLFDQMFRGRIRPDEIEPLCKTATKFGGHWRYQIKKQSKAPGSPCTSVLQTGHMHHGASWLETDFWIVLKCFKVMKRIQF